MRAWKELTATALEGTSKSASGDEAERRLLSEASWHTLRRLAGGKADQIGGGGSALAPEETRPLVSRAAATRLEEILRSDERGHLGEWLDIAAAAGKRVPPSLLPPLLEDAAAHSGIRASLLRAGGARLSWIAHQNEEWAFADIADPIEAFQTGVRPARVAALEELRRHDPAAALATLSAGWDKEGGDDRAALIAVLAVGLGPGDEQFLNAATSDGRKEVRIIARDLLARLPESALIGRMIQRADSMIHFRKGVLGSRLEVEPPASCDEGMIADGIEPKPPKGVGDRAHWLRQVIALVPPSHWPVEYLDAGLKSEWKEPLVQGWTEAAARFRDARWILALIERTERIGLVREMPADAVEAAILDQMRRNPAKALAMATLTDQRLSAAVSAALIGGLAKALTVRDQVNQQRWVYGVARQIRGRLDPAILSDVLQLAQKTEQANVPWATEALQSLAASLEYRAAMAKEILS